MTLKLITGWSWSAVINGHIAEFRSWHTSRYDAVCFDFEKIILRFNLLLKTGIFFVISVRYSSCTFGETCSKFEYTVTEIYKRRDRAWGAPIPIWVWYRVFFCPMVKRPGVKLKTRPHFVLRVRMSGALPLLILYTFIACTETSLPLRLHRV